LLKVSLKISCYLFLVFAGNRNLFKGLAIDSLRKDWNTRIVLRLNFSEVGSDVDLREWLLRRIKNWATKYGIALERKGLAPRTKELLLKLKEVLLLLKTNSFYQKSGQLVILIDEYDTPIIKPLEFTGGKPDKDRAISNASVLAEFYNTFKYDEEAIEFMLVTGVRYLLLIVIFFSHN
jgi:hypothetical protein